MTDYTLLAISGINDLWYALPLLIVISLVYSATRHEAAGAILAHAWRTAVWIVCFMGLVLVVMLLADWWS